MKYKKTLLFSVIIFSLFSGLFSVNSLGTLSNINYTFDNNILFDSNIISYEQPYNLEYQQEYTEHYNATHSFENDIVGNEPIGWIILNNADTFTTIIENLDGHNKVLNLTDKSITGRFFIKNTFSNITFGVIEFWFRMTNKSNRFEIRITNGTSISITSVLSNLAINNNIWYHYKIQFDTTTDLYTHWLNQIIIGSNIPFNINSNFINDLSFLSNSIGVDFSCFVDAIGYFFGGNFDFEQDIIGNEPLFWNINPHGGSSTATVERFQESNVLKVIDDDIINGIHVVTDLIQSIDQSIEYYIAVNDTSLTDWYYMRFVEGGTGRVLLRIDNNDLDFHNGVMWTSVKDDFILIDTWFKITINLHDSVNTFNIFIDDILEGSNLDFITNSIVSVNQLSFESGATEMSITYLDNFNINSTDTKNYFIGQNLIPFLNVSKILMEVDKYEFALNDIHTFNAGGSSNPNGWTDIETGGGDKVIIFPETDGSYDRLIRADTNVIADIRGIEKVFSNIENERLSVSIGFFSTIMDGNASDFINIKINSTEGFRPNVLSVQVKSDLSVWYWNGSESINTNRDIILGSANRYEFNFFFHYKINLVFFNYFHNGILQETFIIYLSTGHYGLSRVEITSLIATSNTLRYFIDYVGIYGNGISLVDDGVDFGIALIPINNAWNFENHNLFTFIAKGTFHLASSPTGYFEGFPFDTIKNITIYNDFTQDFVNIYDKFVGNIADAKLVITVLGNNFNFSYLEIKGVILTEGSNSYNLIFEYSGVDTQESYFYVDTNNKLQFTHISNDTDTEYIQARFNINDSTSTDASISFRSLINNNAKGFFRINYTTTSDFIPFPIVQSTTSIFLTQGNNIRDFLIIITDLDDDTITGLTSGFVDNVKLIFLGNIQISIITLSLIGMIVPLIIILTPTVALRDLYGENFIIPVFLLMSLILVIGGIIPIWLFFIIAISSSLFLIKGNMEKDD